MLSSRPNATNKYKIENRYYIIITETIRTNIAVFCVCVRSLSAAIQCPQPLVPINGRIDGTSISGISASHRKYAVGALVTFSCNEGHLLVGEASIVCTETGFWSHPPPFCTYSYSFHFSFARTPCHEVYASYEAMCVFSHHLLNYML